MKYIVSPYSHELQAVRSERFLRVRAVVIKLIKQRIVAYSPIVYGHQLAHYVGTDFESWREFDMSMIDVADELWVLMIDGWRESVGVHAEIEYAIASMKPVLFLDPETFLLIPMHDLEYEIGPNQSNSRPVPQSREEHSDREAVVELDR